MFEYLADYSRIFVTGPQRSGTRIVALAIAHDLGYEYVDELAFGVDRLDRVPKRQKIVVQCPGLCHCIERLAGGGVAIVLVRRSVEDIVASEKYLGWDAGAELRKYGAREGVISEIKYACWDVYQKELVPHAFEVEYESLVGHPLWVPAEERVGFRWNQTEK